MGFISKLGSKLVSKAAPKAALSLSEQAAEEAVTAAPPKLSLVKPKPAAKAVAEAEPTPTPAAAAEEPVAPSSEITLSLSEQMAKKQGVTAQADEFEQVPLYNFPNKAFTDKQYLEAEKALENSYMMESLYTKLKGNEQKFADELQKKAIKLFGKKGESYELPYNYQSKAKTVDEAVAEVEASKAQKPTTITGEEDIPPPADTKKSIFSGKLGTSRGAESNQILEEIRQLREQNYKELSSMPQTQRFDEPVLDIALGEFRHKYGYEYDPIIRKDNKRIVDLMTEKQKEYDVLKKKYADTPDITIYHGGSREKIASIAREGFRRPSLSKRTAQTELNVGSTSTTTDIALNFNPATGFGGSAENILEKKMPYADYIFTRVNMKPSEYADKDLDATARTITGSPTGVRALRLPRSSHFYETESAYIESDKIKMSKNVDELQPKLDKYQEILTNKRILQDSINSINASSLSKGFDKVSANQAYNTIRKYLENEAKLGRIANVRSGIGEQYEQDMSSLFYRSDMLSKLSEKLREFGMTEKANNVEELFKIAERGVGKGDTADMKQRLSTYSKSISEMRKNLSGKYRKMNLDELAVLADNRDPAIRDYDRVIASLYGILQSNNLSPKNYNLSQLLTMAQPEKHLGSDLLKLTDKFNRGGLVRRK